MSLAIGTPPDRADEENIEMIDTIARKTLISLEFSVESTRNDTLRRINRGHEYSAFIRAMDLSRGRAFHSAASDKPARTGLLY